MNPYIFLVKEIELFFKSLTNNMTECDFTKISVMKSTKGGDISTNAAILFASIVNADSMILANKISDHLTKLTEIEKVEIHKPGFINVYFNSTIWQNYLISINEQGKKYGLGTSKEKVLLEFVSANPTGPLHVGHARGAIYGDVLAKLMKFAGYNVQTEYWVNDAGSQIESLVNSLYYRYYELLGKNPIKPENFYPGEYLIGIAEKMTKLAPMDHEQVQKFAINEMMELIKLDLSKLGINIDQYVYESDIIKSGKVEEALNLLDKKGLLYTGVLKSPKGKIIEDWEPTEQLLFKTTKFGDDQDRVIKKTNQSYTYFTTDLAYHYDKCARGYNTLINVWGADHGGYIKRLKASVMALADKNIDIQMCQMVKIINNDKLVKSSKRSGNIVTIDEILNTVELDAFRFMMVSRKNDSHLDFDLRKVSVKNKENPVYYVQYANARINSVLKSYMNYPSTSVKINLLNLTDQTELSLINKLSYWPVLIQHAAKNKTPHLLGIYLYELASEFHYLWNKGTNNKLLCFITNNEELTHSRIYLLKTVQLVLHLGMGIIGITPKETM